MTGLTISDDRGEFISKQEPSTTKGKLQIYSRTSKIRTPREIGCS